MFEQITFIGQFWNSQDVYFHLRITFQVLNPRLLLNRHVLLPYSLKAFSVLFLCPNRLVVPGSAPADHDKNSSLLMNFCAAELLWELV